MYVIRIIALARTIGIITNSDHQCTFEADYCLRRALNEKMPLVRKLLIIAAVDGLVLQPRSHPHAQQPAIKIDYKGNVVPVINNNHEGDDTLSSFESHGIVGMSAALRTPLS